MTSLSVADCIEELGKFDVTLKEDQQSVLNALCEKKDSYCVLPTGSGKSMIFIGYLLGLKRVCNCGDFIGIIVSPLISLNRNHTMSFEKFGLRYWDLNGDTDCNKEQMPNPDIIITNPEKLSQARKVLKRFSKVSHVMFTIDEVHTILSWGTKQFRPTFKDIDKSLNIFKSRPVILTLTATLTNGNKEELFNVLGFGKDVYQLIRNPVLPNMSFVIVDENFNNRHAKTLRNLVQRFKIETPKCVIFTHSTNETLVIRDLILEDMDEESKGYVNWLTAANSQNMRQNFVEALVTHDSHTRIIITTSLLSLGVDMKGVKYVFVTRMTNTIEDLLQRAGRGGRDGNCSYCVIFTRKENRSSTNSAQAFRRNNFECCRILLNRVFAGPPSRYQGSDRCCSFCTESFVDILISELLEMSQQTKPENIFGEGHKTRSLARGDKSSLARSLEELRQKINYERFNNSSIAPTSLTNGVIKHLVNHARFIFTLEDLEKLISNHGGICHRVLEIFSDEFGDIDPDEVFKDNEYQMEVEMLQLDY